MKTSEDGVNLIKSFEGFRSHAYKAVPSERYYTIGYGHYGGDVQPWDTITEKEAENLLTIDLLKYENKVNQYGNIYNWTQSQFDACVSFAYNCGVGNFDKLVAKGTRTIEEIKQAWTRYNKSGGVVLTGLTKRRNKELELFNKDEVHQNNNVQVDTSNIQVSTTSGVGCYLIVASSLRVRSGAGLEYQQVGSLKNNETTDVTEIVIKDNTIWGKIADNRYICIRSGIDIYAVPYIKSEIVTYSLSKDGNKYITKNFQVKEFACHDGSDKILIDTKLVIYLQMIREYFDRPVHINSGYRNEAYNKKIGGASKSYHMRGMAADIHIDGINPKVVCYVAESFGMLGIGEYANFSHVDTRTSKSFWYGSKQEKRTSFK